MRGVVSVPSPLDVGTGTTVRMDGGRGGAQRHAIEAAPRFVLWWLSGSVANGTDDIDLPPLP